MNIIKESTRCAFMKKLMQTRIEKGYSRAAFARLVGVPLRTVEEQELKNHVPSAIVLYKYAKALGVPMEALIDEEDKK